MCEIKDVIGIDIDDIGYIENLLKLVSLKNVRILNQSLMVESY